MENRNVGWMLIGLSIVIVAIIYIFNGALRDIVNASCTMAGHTSCTMYETITQQTYLSLAIVSIIFIIGLVMLFVKPNEKIVVKKVTEKKLQKKIDMSEFTKEEKIVLSTIQEQGAMFQADLIERTGLGKVTITRILDKLQAKELIERKRRGMNNLVAIKD
jgi:uncharacterized membrane protein